MNALEDTNEEDVCVFLTLDDACLAAILGNLSAQQLRAAAAVCKRLLAISSADSLWIKHIKDNFGLCISTVKGAQRVPGAALQLYNRLQKAKQLPHALPAQALCTDGGCDEPFDAYWAGNMFSSKRAALYCSEANTRNIHVFVRLCPPGDSTASPEEQQQQPAEERRQFLLGRCAQAARHLISQRVVDAHEQLRQTESMQQQQSAAGRWRSLTRLVWERVRPADKLRAATAALQSCSTEGLADFMVAAYMGQQQYASWARSLFSGLNDEQIAHVHEVAFQMWSEMMEPPARHSFLLLPAPPQPALLPNAPAPAAAAAAAAPGPSSTAPGAAATAAHGAAQQQQQQRRLLCAKDQLEAICGIASSAEGTYIVQECIIARDGMSGSTCPVRSGFVFLGHYAGATSADHSTSLLQAGSSSSSGGGGGDLLLHRPAAGEDAVRAAAAGEQADAAVKVLAADLGGMVHQPWVAAAADLTSAAAVHTASRAGLLPPIIDYVSFGGGDGAEYIEFAAPSSEQVRQQQQEWVALCGGSSSSSRGSAGGDGSRPARGLLAPVLWFRFHDAAGSRGDDELLEDDEDEDELDTDELEDQIEQEIPAAAAFGAAMFIQEAEQHVEPGPGSSSSMSAETQDAGSSTSASDSNYSAGQPQQPLRQPQQPQEEAARAMGEDQPGVLQAAAAAAAAAQQAVASDAVDIEAPTPRVVTPSASMVCTAAPDLPVVATEVSAALGWQPAAGHAGMLAVQLLQPRSANLVCALLLDCEDAKPAFNRSRGGCNIDMQLLMLRGHAVGQLPVGLQMAAPGQ
uniref:Uncharacterized protein n=1 Tax=Tetradesmus obliquus TaxID=3088 RepID=A0A383VQA7_TETOB|eukprot:jgi/Sobl393_1/11611/SZX67029.1